MSQTTTCSQYGHPEFRITTEEKFGLVEPDLNWFMGWLEQSVVEGRRFESGQTCQVGWLVLEVRLNSDGTFSLWEPDLQAMPIVWKESVSTTLMHLRIQKDVVESVLSASELSFPSMRQSAIICSRLKKSKSLVLERSQPKGHASGWYFGCRDADHNHNDVSNLQCVSLYEAVVECAPQVVPYLALPDGTLVCVDTDASPSIFKDGEPLNFKPESLLAARHSSR